MPDCRRHGTGGRVSHYFVWDTARGVWVCADCEHVRGPEDLQP